MFELIISVCLLNTPETCKNVHLTYMGQISTPYHCMNRGQPEMAKWLSHHPEWSIRKWRCGRVDVSRKET